MQKDREQQIQEKMMSIAELIESNNTKPEVEVGTINYYKDFNFKGTNLAETDIFVAKVENTAENTNTYEIYSGKTNKLIATVDEQGKLHFMPEYIESLKQIDPRLVEMINLEDIDFELLQELEQDDRVFTREEREHIKSEKESEKTLKQNEEELEQDDNKSIEEQEQEEIAKAKGIPAHNVLKVRTNSNLYKDHPNLEPNLYFYRDNEGVVRTEYLDENGQPQECKYFEPSSTNLRKETVSLGDDGNPVTKEVPYQVMKTKGLNNIDKDIRDVRFNVTFDIYGYMEISEARQGKNGEWLSHDVEMKGREYNSRAVNEATSIRTRKADPDKQTEAYEKVEDTGLEEDGIQFNEMYLMQHAEEFIDGLIKEGYQRKEAIKIFDYMIGEEALDIKEAKEKVNDEIEKESNEQEKQKEERDSDDDYGPWTAHEQHKL